MKKIIWDPTYSVGVPSIDAEHKRLIGTINMLADDPDADFTSETVSDLIAEATDYAISHFKNE
jgi:hemerythrin